MAFAPAAALPTWSVRPEQESDHASVFKIHTDALGIPEAKLVDALRKGNPENNIFLVAVGEDGSVVGHIAFSKMRFQDEKSDFGEVKIAGLGPLSVLPLHQKSGVGAMLVKKGLEECKKRGYAAVAVLGSPKFYGRFGFRSAAQDGLSCAFPGAGDAFQVLELIEGSLEPCEGTLLYDSAFDQLS
eukprot:comp5335_c0_seq1/m.1321 comp5335_c0_seq1/g.1321  ORF comp5335_c0_seq1/g.1321 comp5335_c0_seq1/m.1321 type:complete len:185 (-) comp5335_c0_seq1:65-619(-)